MGPPLSDDIWMRRGITLLWDAEKLARLCGTEKIISLRRFLELHRAGWPDGELSLVGEKTLVVAGLDGCLDVMPPHETETWLEQVVYIAMLSYQRQVADGCNEAALVLWFVDPKRIHHEVAQDTYEWLCDGDYRGQRIALSRCLFNGTQHDLRRIVTEKGIDHPIGLFHPRIS
jgi:hypothetical protein